MVNPIALMAVFEVKHLLADFFLQTPYMLGKFKKTGWVVPLAAHCAVHAAFTFLIALCVSTVVYALAVAVVDFGIHFWMDRIKADPALLGRFEALTKKTYPTATPRERNSNRWFWWSLGIDQFIHNLTHLFIVWVLTRGF